MEQNMKYLITIIVLLFVGCQDNYLTDLTPDDGHDSEWWFNTPSFIDAVENSENVVPGDTFHISSPAYLINQSPYVVNAQWISTDTFVFEQKDYASVMNVLFSTAEQELTDREIINTSQINHSWGNWKGRRMYHGINYYLYPINKIWIRIDRIKDPDKSNFLFTAWRYYAHAVWLIGNYNYPGGDIS